MPSHQPKTPRPVTPSLPSHAPQAVKNGLQSGGRRLDKHTSAEMSAKFGHDFSQVRIHTDHRAGDAAEAMGANAYALGGDIVFGAGQYNPGSRETDQMLAHELTHVVQQSRFGIGDWGRTSQSGDASEREADRLSSQVMLGQSVNVQAVPQAAVARIPDNNAWDDWGDQSAGLGFDHFGLPSTWFIKPPLSDGAPGDTAPSTGLEPRVGGTLAPSDPDPTPGPTTQLPPPGPRVTQPDPTPPFTPPSSDGGGMPYMPKSPLDVDPTTPDWQLTPWQQQQIPVPPASVPQPGDFPAPSTDTQNT
jgi:hypothetical protein